MSEFSNGINPSESEVKKIIVGSPKIYQRTLNESEQRPKTIEVQQRNDRKEKLEILHQKPQSIDSEK